MLETEIQKLSQTVAVSTERLEGELRQIFIAICALTEAVKDTRLVLPAPESQTAVKVTPLSVEADPAVEPAAEAPKTRKRKVEQAPEPAPEPAPSISKDNLKELALQISEADSDAKVEIFAILSAHKVKTITHLPEDPDTMFDVYTRLSNLAQRVAKAAE